MLEVKYRGTIFLIFMIYLIN